MSLIPKATTTYNRNVALHQKNGQGWKYSIRTISPQLIDEIIQSLKSISTHGSVEIYVQDAVVTQISVRNIKKT